MRWLKTLPANGCWRIGYRKAFVAVVLALCVAGALAAPGLTLPTEPQGAVDGLLAQGEAEQPQASAEENTTFVHDPVALRQVMPLVHWRKNGFLNHIYQFDQEPLGDRTPVILIPGRAEEFQHSSWWKKFNKMGRKDPAFSKRYKLYAYIYDSSQYIEKPTDDYIRELKATFADFPSTKRQVVVVSYSLGGMIIRDAFADKAVDELTSIVFGIAVPYHGSPIFDPEWFTEYFRPPNHSPIRKFWDHAVYHLYLYGKENLKAGLGWDNFDASKPFYGEVKLAKNLKGTMLVSQQATYRDPAWLNAFKSKLIIYASYLPNEYTEEPEGFKVSTLLGRPLTVPKAVVGSVLPVYGKSVHSVFVYVNRQLARLPSYSPRNPKGEEQKVYRYNDGVIPLSSMLYLPPRQKPYDEDLGELLQLADVKRIRLFKGIDHMHIGEYSMTKGRITTHDFLNPAEGVRTPNGWVIYDLNRLADVPVFVNRSQ